MKLAAISMIRDEADIIVPFLRHLAGLFDVVFLLDQRSSDGSGAVMREACAMREGWSCYYCDFAGRHQKEVNTIFMRQAFARDVDAVFFIDSDEFVDVSSKAKLHELVGAMNDRKVIGVFPWLACIPTHFDEWHFDVLAPLWISDHDSIMTKTAIPRSVFLSSPEIAISQGSHSVLNVRDEDRHHLQVGHFFHIPVRSRPQLIQKVFLSAIANLAKNNPMIEEAFHKRQLLEIIADRDLSDDVLASLAGKYSEVREFNSWGRLAELKQHGFAYRSLPITLADIPLRPPPQPDFNRVIARCLRDFELEKLEAGEGSLQIDSNVIRFQRTAGPDKLPSQPAPGPATLLGWLRTRLGL